MNIQQFATALLLLLCLASCQRDDDATNIDADDIVDINNDINDQGNNNGNNGGNNGGNNNGGGTITPNEADLTELGRLLFWDPILSGEKDIACATCHHPDHGYADALELSIGVGGEGLGPNRVDATNDDIGLVPRNAPTIINTAFNGMDENGNFNSNTAPMFWDNRDFSLENQALGPIESFEEMRGHAFSVDVALDSIVNRLRSFNQYRTLFASAFGNDNAINSANIATAIATFERTIVATNSPFDEFQAGDNNALSQQEQRGLNRFRQIGCDDCHSGPMFSDYELHTLGVPDNNLLDETDSGASGNYDFRTPTLRNLTDTGPYFHNGVAGNLQQTIQFYITARNAANGNGGGGGGGGGGQGGLNINQNVNGNQIDQEVRNLRNFNNDDVQDIAAFIQALNDPDFDRSIPNNVPSGLNPGGNID